MALRIEEWSSEHPRWQDLVREVADQNQTNWAFEPYPRSIYTLTLPPDEQTTYDEWAQSKQEKVIPLRRRQTPEDIATMAVFVASKRGMNITGQAINVDGGFVMHS